MKQEWGIRMEVQNFFYIWQVQFSSQPYSELHQLSHFLIWPSLDSSSEQYHKLCQINQQTYLCLLNFSVITKLLSIPLTKMRSWDVPVISVFSPMAREKNIHFSAFLFKTTCQFFTNILNYFCQSPGRQTNRLNIC